MAGGSTYLTGTALDGIDSVFISNDKASIVSKTYDRLQFKVPATLAGPRTYDAHLALFAHAISALGKLPLLGQSPTITLAKK